MNDLLKTLGQTAREDRARAPEGDDEAAAFAPPDARAREAMVEAALAALADLGAGPAPALRAAESAAPAPALRAAESAAPAPAVRAAEGAGPAPALRAAEGAGPAPALRAAEGAAPAARPRAAEGVAPVIELAAAKRRAPHPVVARLVRWQVGAAAALACAAAIAFVLLFRPAGDGDGGEALPAYALSLSGSVSELRGEPAAPSAAAKVRPDATLTLVVRPEAPVARTLEARAYVEQGGAWRRVEAPIEISPEGAVRLVARADRLFAPPRGTHRLFVAVGPRGALPEAASLEALRRARGVRVTEAVVTVEAP